MKKLGIIGGAGPLASALLYETLIQESYARGLQVPEMVLINFPFTRGLSFDEGKENKISLINELGYCVQFLIKNGVEIGLLACNTLHLILRNIPQAPVQFYSLPELVIKAALDKKHLRLLILGTENTCRSHLYQHAGIQAIYPTSENQKLLDEVINRVLEGRVLKEDADLVAQIIRQISRSNDLDGVVLGCTDFPVLHHRFPIHSDQPVYDSIKLSAKTIVGSLCSL